MSSGRPDLIQRVSDRLDAVERAFRSGSAIVLPWGRAAAEIACAMRTVERYLSRLPIETSFPGADDLAADRQSLWVASTGLGQQLHTELSDIAHFDGDAEGGVRGLGVLKRDPGAAGALSVLKGELDRALRVAVVGLHLHEELPPACLDAVTVRYRAIRYAPVQREIAGIGVHPDGNVISALVTDRPGLTVLGGPGWIVRPTPEAGTLVMPGSILTRWSDGTLPPTVHAVEIHRADPAKCTMVGFLNFADGSDVPRSLRLTGRQESFRNAISEFKNDDMRPDGGLADFYRNGGFVVMEGDRARFRTFAELVAQT
jgi:2OG-Fe(II) oxygenase superfamily